MPLDQIAGRPSAASKYARRSGRGVLPLGTRLWSLTQTGIAAGRLPLNRSKRDSGRLLFLQPGSDLGRFDRRAKSIRLL
jgi:hypothetical protein